MWPCSWKVDPSCCRLQLDPDVVPILVSIIAELPRIWRFSLRRLASVQRCKSGSPLVSVREWSRFLASGRPCLRRLRLSDGYSLWGCQVGDLTILELDLGQWGGVCGAVDKSTTSAISPLTLGSLFAAGNLWLKRGFWGSTPFSVNVSSCPYFHTLERS